MNLNKLPLHEVDVEMIKVKLGNRQTIDKAKLQELAESMKEHGLIQPVLLQADPKEADVYHLVAGERRIKAAELIGWETIPARVMPDKVADDELRALRLVENLQRVDLTPWEEASQISDLRALHPDDRVEDLANRLGKSATWVAQRLAIGKLSLPLRKLVQEQDWPVGYLPLLARVPLESQAAVLEEIKKEQETDYNDEWSSMRGMGKRVYQAPPLRVLTDFLEDFQHVLSAAPWKLDDAKLLPSAGACKQCPKRLSAQAMLFPEVKDAKKDRCLDAGCWKQKQAALVAVSLEKLKAAKQAPILLMDRREVEPEIAEKLGEQKPLNSWDVVECKQKDKGAKPALYVSGDALGKTIYVKEKPRQKDAMPSRRHVDQTTGEAQPKSEKERLQDLLNKRMCQAVVYWCIDTMPKLTPTLDQVLPLLIAVGMARRASYRDGSAHQNVSDVWAAWGQCKNTSQADFALNLWELIIPVLQDRLKRFGPMESQAKGLWQEAMAQAEAIQAPRFFDDCWNRAIASIKFPKSLSKAGLTDPHADGALPELGAKKKGKGAA